MKLGRFSSITSSVAEYSNCENYYKMILITDKYQNLFNKLNDYQKLKNNWDGYSSKKPSKDIISTAKNFIEILALANINPPQIMVGDGVIGLFWGKNQSYYIELNFDTKDYFTFFYEKQNGDVIGQDDILIGDYVPNILKDILYKTDNVIEHSIISSEQNNESHKAKDYKSTYGKYITNTISENYTQIRAF